RYLIVDLERLSSLSCIRTSASRSGLTPSGVMWNPPFRAELRSFCVSALVSATAFSLMAETDVVSLSKLKQSPPESPPEFDTNGMPHPPWSHCRACEGSLLLIARCSPVLETVRHYLVTDQGGFVAGQGPVTPSAARQILPRDRIGRAHV